MAYKDIQVVHDPLPKTENSFEHFDFLRDKANKYSSRKYEDSIEIDTVKLGIPWPTSFPVSSM